MDLNLYFSSAQVNHAIVQYKEKLGEPLTYRIWNVYSLDYVEEAMKMLNQIPIHYTYVGFNTNSELVIFGPIKGHREIYKKFSWKYKTMLKILKFCIKYLNKF